MKTEIATDTVIKKICNTFRIEGEYIGFSPVEMGNINKTYKAHFIRDGLEKNYIVQKINTFVFNEPVNIMKNVTLITKHIHDKVAKNNGDTKRCAVRYFTTADDKNYHIAENGDFWRVSRCVADSISFNTGENAKILHGAGAAFGEFQMLLSDFDASKLAITIKDFHNTPVRLKSLFDAAKRDEAGRAAEVASDLEWFYSIADEASRLENMRLSGEVRERVTHNDTKVNNVLFDKNSKDPLVVVDLDTVMPGLAMHDFGDAVRSAANTCEEDETDLDKVEFDLDRYTSFAEGFISKTAHALEKREIETMALGALTITVELASRFLADYINGDKYFKTLREKHNLDRARCQLKLASDISKKMDEMNEIVKKIAESAG